MEWVNHQPVLKFLHFFPASLQATTMGISKLVDDKAGSILWIKNKISLKILIVVSQDIKPLVMLGVHTALAATPYVYSSMLPVAYVDCGRSIECCFSCVRWLTPADFTTTLAPQYHVGCCFVHCICTCASSKFFQLPFLVVGCSLLLNCGVFCQI